MDTTVIRDKKGKVSSMRVALLISILIFCYLLFLFQKAFLLEIQKDVPNYLGLTSIFTAMIAQVGLTLLLKVFQKKYEDDSEDNKERPKRQRHDS